MRSLCRLELDDASPLTPRTSKMEDLRNRSTPERAVGDGVWWSRIETDGSFLSGEDLYFTVAGDALQVVTKAQAYCALGAVERLHAMGLGDAAVSLQAGDFDHASVQVIAERDRLKGG